MSEVPTPCRKICTFDPACGFCTGCFRTLDEIGRWASMSLEERAQVLEALEVRRSQPFDVKR